MKYGSLLLIAALYTLALPAAAHAETDPPTTTASVSPAPNGFGWHNGNVTVTLHAEDAPGPPTPSGVAKIVTTLVLNGAEATEETAGADATRIITAEGATTVNYGAVDADGNQESFKQLPVWIDRTDPTVAIDGPAEGSSVPQGALIGISWVCEDALSGLDTCHGPSEQQRDQIVDTSTPGTRSISIIATDKAGNQLAATRTWTVVASGNEGSGGSGGSPRRTFGTIVTLPSARTCIRRQIIFSLRRTSKVSRATFYINGKRKRTVRGSALRRPIALSRLPSRRFTVKLVVQMRDGRRYTGSRRYRRC